MTPRAYRQAHDLCRLTLDPAVLSAVLELREDLSVAVRTALDKVDPAGQDGAIDDLVAAVMGFAVGLHMGVYDSGPEGVQRAARDQADQLVSVLETSVCS